jgi:hypothetical protein
MRTDGSPLEIKTGIEKRPVQVGDVERDPDTQAPAPVPSLGKPGEKLPGAEERGGTMKPVLFPKPKLPEPQPGANPDGEPDAQPPASTPTPPADAPQAAPEVKQPQPTPASQPK